MTEPHSAIYLGDWRDHWWDPVSLAAWFERDGLHAALDIADVGCGIGHWGTLVWRLLGGARRFHFVDREPEWIRQLEARVHAGMKAGLLEGTFSAQVGDAMRLPYEDGSMDLVTCQTLLIHLADPRLALREFRRVLRPGGRVLLSEPNNIGNTATFLAPELRDCTEDALRELRFCLRCELGKAKLGLGFNSLGEELPGLLLDEGYKLVSVRQNERPNPLVPPYDSPAARAEVELMRDFAARGIYGWPREEAARYFAAAGGEDFDAEYDFVLGRDRERLAELDAGRFARTRGQLNYLCVAEVAAT